MDPSLEANKRVVRDFYDAVVNRKDFSAASTFLGDRYTQHNPLVGDGREGLREFINVLRERFPQARSEVLRVFADADYVILHVLSTRAPGTNDRAIVESLRLEDRRVVEHWDVIQEVPVSAANPNGMF